MEKFTESNFRGLSLTMKIIYYVKILCSMRKFPAICYISACTVCVGVYVGGYDCAHILVNVCTRCNIIINFRATQFLCIVQFKRFVEAIFADQGNLISYAWYQYTLYLRKKSVALHFHGSNSQKV